MTLSVQIDWRAYFADFCRRHGGDPVERKGVLLFRDGWTYSVKDHRGPEWPPPADPAALKLLKLEYWRTRRRTILEQLSTMQLRLTELEFTQSRRSAPLTAVTRRRVRDESGKMVTKVERGPLDLAPLRGRVESATAALDECEAEIRRLQETGDASDTGAGGRGDAGDHTDQPEGDGVRQDHAGGVPVGRSEVDQGRR